MSPAYCRQKLSERGLDVSRMSDAAVVMHYTGKQYYPSQGGESRQDERPEQELLPAENRALFRMPGFVRAVCHLLRHAAERGDFAPTWVEMEEAANIQNHRVQRALITLERANIIRQRRDLAKNSKRACYELPLCEMMTRGKDDEETPGERLLSLLHKHYENGEPLPLNENIARLCGYASAENAKRALASYKGRGIEIEIVGEGASITRYVRSVGRKGVAA